MAGEYADKTESLRPIAGLMMRRKHRPFHSQFRGNVRCCLLLQEYSKLPKTLRHAPQLESQAAPERDVIVDGLSQRLSSAASWPWKRDGTKRYQIHFGVDSSGIRASMPQQITDLIQGGAMVEHPGG